MNPRKLFLIGIAVVVASFPLRAVENAVGRTLPGVWVMPQGGVVPKQAGLTFTLMPVGYLGEIGGQAPIAGILAANVSARISENLLIPQFVYKTEFQKVNFSSAFYLPVNWQAATGFIQLNEFTRSRTDVSRGLADVFFSPLTVGIHFSENNNLAIDTKIWAPTGAFKTGDLSNLGMNVWTIQPNLAHTLLWKKRGIEVDNYVSFDIYSRNPATHYKSGVVFSWQAMLLQYLSERFGFGAVVSNVTQITDDSGPLANRLNGFRGRAWAAGPVLLYVAKPKDPGVTLQLRYVPEFTVTNFTKGYTLLFGVTLRM
jgi:hypothetical protein